MFKSLCALDFTLRQRDYYLHHRRKVERDRGVRACENEQLEGRASGVKVDTVLALFWVLRKALMKRFATSSIALRDQSSSCPRNYSRLVEDSKAL